MDLAVIIEAEVSLLGWAVSAAASVVWRYCKAGVVARAIALDGSA